MGSLQLKGVSLRRLKIKDAREIARLLNNKKIWDNLRDYIPYPYTEKDAIDFIKRENIEDPFTVFSIVYKAKFTGIISLKRQSDIHRISAEIGYWIGEEYWGKGITHKAIRLMTGYAFEKLGLIKIFAIVMAGNEASCKALEKAGYSREGYFRQALIKNGQICDEVRMGITPEEFNNRPIE